MQLSILIKQLSENYFIFLIILFNKIITYMEFVNYVHTEYVFFALIFILLCWYYSKFTRYNVFYKTKYETKRKNKGNPLPPYVNGWFIAARSDEIKINQIINLEKWGKNIALFRGTNNIVYALDAYCAHMGSNLAVQGIVKNQNCIQCPFHGWSYDGQTGYCVDSNKKPIRGISFQYSEDKPDSKKLQWKQCQTEIKLKKYTIKEQNGYVFIWLHALKQFQNTPTYDLLNIEQLQKFSYRGRSHNLIKCHIQDIPENGSDVMHFYYVHKYFGKLVQFFYLTWQANWMKGTDPNIQAQFTHKINYIHDYKQKLYNKYFKNYKQKEKLGVLSVDGFPYLPIIGSFFLYNLTVIQLGSGIVYIFLKTKYWQLTFVQYFQTEGKYTHNLYHELYMPNWCPYWMSAVSILGQAIQVYNDSKIWDAKTFKRKVTYIQGSKYDLKMKQWREWYYQFYEGRDCQQRNDFDW